MQMQESGAWQHGVSQEGLDNLVWINNFVLQYAPLVQSGGYASGEEDEPTEGEEEIVMSDAEDFTSGIRRWPRFDVGESTPQV
jgi:hypothetical protein